MIKINLLSPLDKENLKWEKVNNLASKNILWVLLSQAIFVGIFFSSIEYLKAKSEAAAAKLTSINAEAQTRETNSIEREIRQNSSKAEAIYQAQSGHVSWTMLFEDIGDILPVGVKLESIDVEEAKEEATASKPGAGNAPAEAQQAAEAALAYPEAAQEAASRTEKRYRIEISGNAKTRDLLLAFEDKLKTAEIFADLEHDKGNYIKSTDIDFNYAFYVKEKDLIR